MKPFPVDLAFVRVDACRTQHERPWLATTSEGLWRELVMQAKLRELARRDSERVIEVFLAPSERERQLVDALGYPLIPETMHTFSNGGEWPEIRLSELAKVAREIKERVFRFRSLKWFAERYLERVGEP